MPRKNCNQWVHYKFVSVADNGEQKTECGKTARRIKSTWEKNSVTCPRCIELMRMNHWHCPKCGFIEGRNVTNDEHCELCGEAL